MRSKNYQLMLLTGALTVSFTANAVEVKDNENTTRVEVKDNSAEHTPRLPTPTSTDMWSTERVANTLPTPPSISKVQQ